MTQLYLETATDLQAAKIREYLGREFGRSLDIATYPIPPDTWPGMNDSPPASPPPESYTLYWVDPLPKIGGGGVFVLGDDIITYAASMQAETLSDGSLFSLDISADAKTAEQLSAAGQVAIIPPTPPGG